jgi:hypothetical protein
MHAAPDQAFTAKQLWDVVYPVTAKKRHGRNAVIRAGIRLAERAMVDSAMSMCATSENGGGRSLFFNRASFASCRQAKEIALERVLRPNGPTRHALSQGRGVPTKPTEPDLAPVAHDRDRPSTGERAAICRARQCGQTRIGVTCHHSWESPASFRHGSLVPAVELSVVNKF